MVSHEAADHYAVLGLDRRCTAAQIRSAFRLLAKRHHPDVNSDAPNAVARAQELNAAYEILSDPFRRRAYDRELRAQETPKPRAGKIERHIKQDAYLRLEDFVRGTQLEVRVNDPGNPNGTELYELSVPPETAPGTRFQIRRDEPFAGGLVQLRVRARPNARFKIRGSDVQTDLRLSADRAVRGGVESIAGITGRMVRIAFPAAVSRGEIIRVDGEGLPKARGGRGDLLIRIVYRPELRISRMR